MVFYYFFLTGMTGFAYHTVGAIPETSIHASLKRKIGMLPALNKKDGPGSISRATLFCLDLPKTQIKAFPVT